MTTPPDNGLCIAVLGLGFGQKFVPIYLSHPAVSRVVLVEPDDARRAEVAARYGVTQGYRGIDEALLDDQIDAVHILAPVPFHAEYAIRVLEAGKHCACAVPAATTREDLERLIETERRTGMRYMMMETSVYGREFRWADALYREGALGDVTFYRGVHIQNLDGFPSYWQGFPPMHYLTHALSPALALLGTSVESVTAHGSGHLDEATRAAGGFDNPFPTEVGAFRLRNSDVIADVQMSFFRTAREYLEGFWLYGSRMGLEWPTEQEGPMLVHTMSGPVEGGRGNRTEVSEVEPPDKLDQLTEELHTFVHDTVIQLPGMAEPVSVGAGHGGSHPYLVDEFVTAITEGRRSRIDSVRAAEWTLPGMCAHESAMSDGARIDVPRLC
ncbi:Gfo/Idh/MocA family protein [Brachybacterium sacelli]|uniref:Dehydrogenase n=1 Tax=Brachybacterium sacelli TaxID=173364 RepID=A0ABS4WX49_9MICO|nr:Gfo/Idh/MocA family oxidoreductase [Brachybacterium sacelli]MBP2380731.1 putative dehydrogenase [Brachybacterium sacelli]